MDSEEYLRNCSIIARLLVCLLGIYATYCMYRKWINGKEYNKKTEATIKVAIVTGASSGIGKETAFGLAMCGVHVIMACRDMEKAAKVRDDIICETGNKNVKCMKLDLASFKSIRSFAEEFLAMKSRLDILINNAGVMGIDRQLTEDGLEKHIGVNHFGHFLLTMLLLKRMSESAPSRIINVSSWVHRLVEFHRDDIMGEKRYNRFHAYAQSKLANIYFTLGLSKRLCDSGITCNTLHPGIVFTDLSRNLKTFSCLLHKAVCDLISKLFFKTTRAGAHTILRLALDFNIQTINGLYFSNVQVGKMGANTEDDELVEWFWQKSLEITGVSFDECFPQELRRLKLVHSQ